MHLQSLVLLLAAAFVVPASASPGKTLDLSSETIIKADGTTKIEQPSETVIKAKGTTVVELPSTTISKPSAQEKRDDTTLVLPSETIIKAGGTTEVEQPSKSVIKAKATTVVELPTTTISRPSDVKVPGKITVANEGSSLYGNEVILGVLAGVGVVVVGLFSV